MTTVARETPWDWAAESASQVEDAAGTQPKPAWSLEDLLERYQRADMHERLCLWLHYREYRQEMEEVEGVTPPAPAPRRGWLSRLLGLPAGL